MKAKPKAFEPPRDRRLSLFRVTGMTENAIWKLGRRHVEPERKKRVLGRAAISVEQVRKVGLSLMPDDLPCRHANVEGWPEKDEVMSLMQELAAEATLHLVA